MFCSSCGGAIDEGVSFCEHCGDPVSRGVNRNTTVSRTSDTSEAPSDPLLGLKLDGIYELQDVQGHGGMGTVYRGINLRLDQPVAVKVLAPNLAANEQLMARFEAEGRIQARLRHPNIVAVQDFVEEGGVFAIVMELVAGQPLDELIQAQAGPLPVERITCIMGQVLRAISFAHEHQVIHRDIKPANIIISTLQGEEVAKVMDFGIAKAMAEGGALTGTSAKMGTIWYMSPEQCQSSKYVDVRADIYSLGIVLYEMATGQLPFDSDSELELMMSHLERPVPPPSEACPGVSPALSAIIVKALAKAPEERYQTAAEMAAALASLDDTERASAAPPPREAPVVSREHRSAPVPTEVVTAAPPPRTGRSRSVLPWVVSGVALLAAAGLASVLFLRTSHPRSAAPGEPVSISSVDDKDEDTMAWLKLETPVASASVLVDGKPIGTTLLKKPLELEAGRKHTVVVEAERRVPWRDTFRLEPGETLKLKPKLKFRADIARRRTEEASRRLFNKLVAAKEAFTKKACVDEDDDAIIEVVATVLGDGGTGAVQVRHVNKKGRLVCAEKFFKTLKIRPLEDGESVRVQFKISVDWYDATSPLKRIGAKK